MINIFIKEFNSFLDSFIAYVIIGAFLVIIGMLMWVFPETSVLNYGYADMSTLFSLGPYAFIFLIPAITMKSFAEERKLGTLEFLFTKPVSEWSIVWGKFLAGYALVVISIVPSIMYCFSIYQLGDPVGNMDIAGVATSYMGLILLGGLFCAVGIFSSSITSSQILAFVITGFICLTLYIGFDLLSSLVAQGAIALHIKQLGILYHYESMSRGLVDSRDMVYFLSVIMLAMGLTKMSLSYKK